MSQRLFMDHPLQDLERIAEEARTAGAAKLLLLAGEHPALRMAEALIPHDELPALHFAQTQALADALLDEAQRLTLEETGEVVLTMNLNGTECELVVFYGEGSHNLVITL